MKNLIRLCTLALMASLAYGDVFTALAGMDGLLSTEEFLLDVMRRYIEAAQEKVNKLQNYLNEFKCEHNQAKRGIEEYLSNPINAYLITKRLTADWQNVEYLISGDAEKEFMDAALEASYKYLFPTEGDLNGAAAAINRLLRTYNLNTSSVANGELNGVFCGRRLSSSDCFELGRQSYISRDFEKCDLWMKEALYRYHKETNKTSDLLDIISYLTYSSYKLGKTELALQITKKLLKLNPKDEKTLKIKKFYEKKLEESKRVNKENDAAPSKADTKDGNLSYESVDLGYIKLCRKEFTQTEEVKAKLRCKYVDFGRPFLKLARLKEEEANLNPRIVIYHDVIYDREIKVIKALSIPRFERAGVASSESNEGGFVDYRISEVAWLDDYDHPRVDALTRRVNDITGLNMETSEKLQVLNYGIGGHYEPHYDFSEEDLKNVEEMFAVGRRLATMLFYLNDVTQGGATVFPYLNVTVWPKKGTAVLWYNLYKSGDGDFDARHAACPVLLGTKWVATKWIHERGQEFVRPCSLERFERHIYD